MTDPMGSDLKKGGAMSVRFFLITLGVFLVNHAFCTPAPRPYSVEEGKHKQAYYKIVVPENWNKKLLIKAHGGRPETARVSADFVVEGSFCEAFIKSGWMVAESSYRRNGIFVNDAVLDIKDLLDLIEDKHGKPSHIYLSGTSMGGKIGVQMAEEEDNRLSGVLAVGAALWCKDKTNPTPLTHCPRIPVLFYSNRNELEGPKDYLKNAQKSAIPPALWTSGRKGHCNLNTAEMFQAMSALIKWSEKGVKPRSKQVDVEIARKDSTAKYVNGEVSAKVMKVHPVYGSFNLDCTRADLEKLGIKQGNYFNICFQDKTFKVYLGHGYGDVPKGEWISFVTADDYVKIARSGANAEKLLHCTEGDEILIEVIGGK